MSTYNLNILINSIFKNSGIINLNKGVGEITKNIEGLTEKLSKAGSEFYAISELVKPLQNAISGAVQGSVNEFMEFEKQMSKVKAITGATDEQFQELNKIAKEMGATTAYTAKEAGDALEFLGMAGLSVQESMDALPGALQLAAAGNLSLGESADIATNIMAQFSIEAKNIGRVNDVLAKSATSANTSVQEMAEAMKYLGPISNSLGISLEESASVVNILANNGIKAGMATQAFSSSLLRLAKPSKEAGEMMADLEFSAFNADGTFKSFTQIVGDLDKALEGLTVEQKTAFIGTVFGSESTKQWLTLLKEGTPELERYTKMLNEAGGSAKKMADVQLDNLAGSFTLLKSAISGIMIDIGSSIAQYLRPAIDSLTYVLSNFKEIWAGLSPEMKTFLKIIGSVAAGFTGLLVVASSIALVLPLLTAGLMLLGGAFSVLFSPITIVIGLIAAFILAYQNNFLGIADITNSVFSKISEFFGFFIESLGSLAGMIFDYFERIKGPFLEFSEIILPHLQGFFDIIINLFYATFDNIILYLQGAWNIISGVFQIAFGLITGIFEIFINLFTGNWEGLGLAVINLVTNLWKGVKNIFIGAFQMLSALVSEALEILKGIFSIAWEGIKLVCKIAWEGILGVLKIIWESIKILASGIFEGIKFIISGIWEGLKSVTSTIWEGLKTGLSDIWNGILNSATSIFTGIADSITGIFQGAIDFVKEAWESIKSIWSWVTGASDDINKKNNSINTIATAKSIGSASLTGGRAYGGPVGAGKSYIVGERGPEMFIPAQNGTIIPNNSIGGAIVNINMGGVVVKTEADEIRLIEKMKTELTRTLQLNKRGIL